jgi:hypothetical protein
MENQSQPPELKQPEPPPKELIKPSLGYSRALSLQDAANNISGEVSCGHWLQAAMNVKKSQDLLADLSECIQQISPEGSEMLGLPFLGKLIRIPDIKPREPRETKKEKKK